MKRQLLLVLCTFLITLFGCKSTQSGESDPKSNPKTETKSDSKSGRFTNVKSFAYQLQDINLDKIKDSKFDLVIIDYSRDGSDDGQFSRQEIEVLKNDPVSPKIVLAYMSIGEAEDYRAYWKKEWKAKGKAPGWLGPENPEWKRNYKVKYWDPQWQSIIYGTPNSYLDKIIDNGFDGVYLDIIDAYEYWGPDGESGLNRKTAEQEMVDFVKSIAHYAREVKDKKDFGVFPQNGEGLASHPDFVSAVTGIGKEDTWFNGNKPQPESYTNKVISNLDGFKKAGKLVLTIDYITKKDLINKFYSNARKKGYIPYASQRGLNVLTINPGLDEE